ncbi:MAG TPA: molybdopterin-dependent oxidoreductase [Fimbriimonadaceae bacterium]|nr:molybdopterin-dependent oxidoreductase [Fimbriimonadaceae bacterium]
MSEPNPREELRRISRRSFLWAGAALIGTYGGFKFLAGRRHSDGLPWPLRRTLEFNEDIWTDAFSKTAMAPTFDPQQRTEARVNGPEGLDDHFDPTGWTLSLENAYGHDEPVVITLDEIKKMPRQEFTTQLCCVEGWSMIVTWAGVRFRDFAAKYMPGYRDSAADSRRPPDLAKIEELVRYVYMETPNGGYYVGLDMQSILHPQTLLCYEMNGQPLTLDHGAPLRLVIPVKYGYKNLKRIGLIRYTDEKPADFWAEQGYDWYAGL